MKRNLVKYKRLRGPSRMVTRQNSTGVGGEEVVVCNGEKLEPKCKIVDPKSSS